MSDEHDDERTTDPDREPVGEAAPEPMSEPDRQRRSDEQDTTEPQAAAAHDAVESADVAEPVDAAEVADAVEPVDAAGPVDLATDVTATDREAAANEAAERARVLQPRTVGLWGVRAAAGVMTISVGVLAVLAGPSFTTFAADPRVESVVPDVPADTRVCAGPLLGIGDASGDAGAVGVLAAPRLVAAADEQEDVAVAGVDAAAQVLRGSDVVGAESLTVADAAASGAAASECTAPSTSQWLVGGSTTTGRSSVLTVANPGRVATSVDVRIFGADGEVQTVGSTGVAIAAGNVAVLDLASLAPGIAAPVVHVAASGGPVSARLQHTVVRTLQPGGVDLVDPTQAATSLAIPGVVVGEPTGVQTQEGFADAAPSLRAFAAESTQATITTIVEGGEPIVSTLDLVGGEVQEIDLSSLAPGTYAFRIESDVPIVAGARQVRVDGAAIDLDWVAAATSPLAGVTTVAIAPGQDPRIHVLNVGDEAATAVVDGQALELAADGLRTLPAQEGVVTIEGDGIVAVVTYAGSDGIAGYGITPRPAARSGLDVVL